MSPGKMSQRRRNSSDRGEVQEEEVHDWESREEDLHLPVSFVHASFSSAAG